MDNKHFFYITKQPWNHFEILKYNMKEFHLQAIRAEPLKWNFYKTVDCLDDDAINYKFNVLSLELSVKNFFIY